MVDELLDVRWCIERVYKRGLKVPVVAVVVAAVVVAVVVAVAQEVVLPVNKIRIDCHMCR